MGTIGLAQGGRQEFAVDMTHVVHYTAAGTTRPACGTDQADTSTTIVDEVTCGACRHVIMTVRRPTPHGRTNR
ncbi:hypothetical protein GCM10009796_10650 [Microbacterium koreense]